MEFYSTVGELSAAGYSFVHEGSPQAKQIMDQLEIDSSYRFCFFMVLYKLNKIAEVWASGSGRSGARAKLVYKLVFYLEQ